MIQHPKIEDLLNTKPSPPAANNLLRFDGSFWAPASVIQGGVDATTYPGSSELTNTISIVFSPAFTAAPRAVVAIAAGSGGTSSLTYWRAQNLSSTGADLIGRTIDGSSPAMGTVADVYWIALGPNA